MKIKIIDFGYKTLPKRAHYNDAGIDVAACLIPRDYEAPMDPFEIPKYYPKKKIWANSSVKIPLGFGVEIPDGYVGFICPRSGLSSKGITCELSPIDSGYRGEIHAIITNCTNSDYWITDGDRVGQLVILPCVMAELVTGFDTEERGVGAFGSTGIS